MATYAIGDLQGCFRQFQQLLERIRFDPARDRLWLVGDLVNRGPESLDVLRWLVAHDHCATVVLGNHDLYLLGRAANVTPATGQDTLGAVLYAPDRDALIDWLRRRPVVVCDERHLMVHAGFHPRWELERDILAQAAGIEAALRAPDWKDFVALYFRRPRPPWSPSQTGRERLASALGVMTRIRFVGADCEPLDGSGPPERARPGVVPWFRAATRAPLGRIVVHGHWASLGLWIDDSHYALDSGCVWGGLMTALRLEDRATYAVPCRDEE
ncbi:MAG: symmetrical bis(5'-nucleosyl)-tetraphosphatase [Myxococcota bacterium]